MTPEQEAIIEYVKEITNGVVTLKIPQVNEIIERAHGGAQCTAELYDIYRDSLRFVRKSKITRSKMNSEILLNEKRNITEIIYLWKLLDENGKLVFTFNSLNPMLF